MELTDEWGLTGYSDFQSIAPPDLAYLTLFSILPLTLPLHVFLWFDFSLRTCLPPFRGMYIFL